MDDHVATFLVHLANSGKSQATQHQYHHKLQVFFAWAGDRPITGELLNEYKLHRQAGEGRRPRTVRGDFAALWSFLDWLEDQGLATDLPRKGCVKMPRLDSAQRIIPTGAQVSQLFKAAERMPGHTPRKRYLRGRALAILTLLADCGLRRGELLALNVGDIWQGQGQRWQVHVRCGKGAQARQVPCNDRAHNLLSHWLDVRRGFCVEHRHTSDALIPVDRKRRLGGGGLDLIWAELLEMAELTESGLTPHSLRHWFGTRTAAAKDLPTAQRLLGHSSLETTYQYLHTDQEAMNAAVDALCDDPAPDRPLDIRRQVSSQAPDPRRPERVSSRRPLPRRPSRF